MKELIQEGKTVEDAINKALEKLKMEKDQVEITVMDEGNRGILGIIAARDARVKVSPRASRQEKAIQFVEELCSKLGVEMEIEAIEDEGDPRQLTLKLKGRRMGLVIGKRGQTIDALQYLTNLVANKGEGESYLRVILDAEGYRDKRKTTLENLARRLAEKALRNGRRLILEPMPPHERRVIHMVLQDDGRVQTYSEGDEPYRKVVIDLEETQ